MKSKRGAAPESATASVATLILLILLFLLAYLVLLPKEAREDVLEGRNISFDDFNGNGDDNGDNGDVDKEVLLLREPGVVLPPGKNEVKKDFASINLMESSQRSARKLADRITVTRTLFNNNYKDVDFEIKDDNLEDLNLFFNVVEQKGGLIIELNGRVIFEGVFDINDLPIKLPVDDLSRVNKLRFMAENPGWALLSTNKYVIRDIDLIKESSVVNKQELRKFEIARAEAISDAKLEFFVNCIEINRDQGILKVFMNRRNVFLSKVVCDASQMSFDVPDDYFNDGTNYLTFEIDKGNYVIEQIRLKYKFDEGFNPQYFFTIDEDQFDDIKKEDAKVKLKLRFDNDEDRKRAEIRVNSGTVFLDQNDDKFEKDISKHIEEGENFIKIFAKDEFNIVLLEVDFIKE
ncbi:hypothetical protein HYV88_01625 [Candidatus Woesearchaeota archaeon]|nr:hypothetical protein [Candidatus Woesearchaeota archaeon]